MLPSRRDIIRLLGAGAAAAAFAPRLVAAGQPPRFPSGAIIRTVLEDLPPDALAGGATLFHEHMSVGHEFMPRVMAEFRKLLGPDVPLPPLSVSRTTAVDRESRCDDRRNARRRGRWRRVHRRCGPPGHGPEFPVPETAVAQIRDADRGGHRVLHPAVLSAGHCPGWSEDQIAQELVRQTKTDAIGAFGEIGTWDAMTPDERKVFRAVGKAHLATNLPIFTHTNMGKSALEQLDVLESVGVKPERVAIGHLGGVTDSKAELQKAICKRGAFVGFDRQGGAGDADQVPAVMALIEAGYADKLLFSSDFSFASDLKHNGGAGYAMSVTVFGPKLRQAGVPQSTVAWDYRGQPTPIAGVHPEAAAGRLTPRVLCFHSTACEAKVDS